ncbi:50S ribosomal protein P1 [Candidatus Micrarchaeota archaeon]|nr:50S ribosomal protein P1 [Candidatus Micrarchaeota archaeon]
MEYVYAAMLLNAAKQPVSEENVKKVLSAAGVSVNDTKVKALVTSLDGVNIDEEKKKAVFAAAAPAAGEAKKEEKKKEEGPSEEQKEAAAAEGLSALFG